MGSPTTVKTNQRRFAPTPCPHQRNKHWRDPLSAGHPFPHPLAVPHTRQVADCLGRAGGAPQRRCVGLHSAAARANLDRVPSRLRPGTESGRVSMVPLEAARVAQFLPGQLRPIEPARTPGTEQDAPSTNPGLRILATSRTVSLVTILCNPQ